METVMDVLSCFPSNTEVLETFLIEDLLDFGDDADIGAPIEHEHSGNSTLTEESSPSASLDGNSWSSETGASKEQLPESMLCVPPDTLADLEWLSTFEEDSFCLPDFSTPLPPVDYVKAAEEKPENIAERCKFTCNFPVPGRARSKRSRTGGRVWSYGCAFPTPNLNARAYPLESSDSSSSTVGRPSKKHKRKVNGAPAGRKPAPSAAAVADGGANQRKCSHCHVTKTPQWRAGPLGPKTLCNACGVRFKSGRLVPEYRPALSPTFLSEIHSNSHRKILEMRRQKEQQQPLHQQIQHQPRNFQAQNHAQAQNHDDVAAALVKQEEDGEKMKMESQGSATEQEDQKTSVH